MATSPTTPPAPPSSGEVPLAVWPCGQPTTPPGSSALAGALPLPPLLARRLLAEYTVPGDLVYDLDDGTVQTAAVSLGRPATRLVTVPGVARRARAVLRAHLPAAQRRLAVVRLVEVDHTPPRLGPSLLGGARLLVATHHGPEPGWLANRARNWPLLLAPGGIVAVVTRACPTPGGLVDNAALVTAACEQAGLGYLQHVIALLVPIRDGRLHPEPPLQPPPEPPSLPASMPPGAVVPPVQLPVHADVLIFTNTNASTGVAPESGWSS